MSSTNLSIEAAIDIVSEGTTDTTYGDDDGKLIVTTGETLTATGGESFDVVRFLDFNGNGLLTGVDGTETSQSPTNNYGSLNASYSGDLFTGLDSYGTGTTSGYILSPANYNAYIYFVDEAGNRTEWYHIDSEE